MAASLRCRLGCITRLITPGKYKNGQRGGAERGAVRFLGLSWPHVTKNPKDDIKDDEDDDITEKLSAVYGETWKEKLAEKPMDPKHFREIPEFLKPKNKTLTSGSAKGLSDQLAKYTRNCVSREENVKRGYWPLVKCVTVRVPNNDFLQHVTLMDLPGNGDCNNNRDEMWRGIVGNCSTVWVVADVCRVVSDKGPWEILEEVCSLIGNGGECRRIGFICAKSDQLHNK